MIEYISRHPHISAVEVAQIVDGKPSTSRHFVIPGVCIVDAETFGVFYAPKSAPVETPKPKRETKRAVRGTKRVAVAQVIATEQIAAEPIVSKHPTLRARILALLKKAPSTSRELYDALYVSGVATTHGSVYATCADLKHAGLIESRFDETDGKQKWFPKAAA